MSYRIFNNDSLNKLPEIKSKSIDLIVIDPPYNIKKANWDTWKTIKEYVEFMGKVFTECERVLKNNGNFYFFHNDFLQIVELQNWLNKNSKFIFNSIIHWNKPNFRALSWKNPSNKNNLRSWFNCIEYCLFYTFQDSTGLDIIKSSDSLFLNIKNYLVEEKKKSKLTLTDLNEILVGKRKSDLIAKRYFGVSQWELPTKKMYLKLQSTEYFKKPYEDLRKEYEDLRKEYEDLRYTHNLDKNHNNIWTSKEHNSGKFHPTQKPLDIIERIIETSSNENDIILDCFMGSGTTGIACQNLNRQFIGIEKDITYFNISKKRLESNKKNILRNLF